MRDAFAIAERVGKNFVYQLVRKLKAGDSMNVPSDQVCPVQKFFSTAYCPMSRRLEGKGTCPFILLDLSV